MTYSNVTLPKRLSMDQATRFWIKVDLPPSSDGCWIWQGAVSSAGYGVFRLGGRLVKAHRLAYALRHGEIPEELVLDHVAGRCTSARCVNPAHLEPVPQRENVRRGRKYLGPSGSCKRGHKPNWKVRKRTPYGTSRVCMTCVAELRKARRS